MNIQSLSQLMEPGWKVCQLRTECQKTDKILGTKIEINVHTKIAMEIAGGGFSLQMNKILIVLDADAFRNWQ